MNWKIKLGAWLLKAYTVKKDVKSAEVLVFADREVLDFVELNALSEKTPFSVPVTFIAVVPIKGIPISSSIFVVNVPKT